MNELIPPSDSDSAVLRGRLARLLQGLKQSRDQNPATLEALERIFPEMKDEKPATLRPRLLKLKEWLIGRRAA